MPRGTDVSSILAGNDSYVRPSQSLDTQRTFPVDAYGDEILPFRHPWDRQPGETSDEYSLFRIYKDLGTTRSLSHLSNITGRNINFLRGLHHSSNWQERAAAFDAYMEDVMTILYARGIDAKRRLIAKLLLEVVERDISIVMAKQIMEDHTETKLTDLVSRILSNIKSFGALTKIGSKYDSRDTNREININLVPAEMGPAPEPDAE